jgi:hypothetical protein
MLKETLMRSVDVRSGSLAKRGLIHYLQLSP